MRRSKRNTGTKSDTQTAIVIGAGLGGLSAAIRLAASGRRVTVYEQQPTPGGKAGTEVRDGYRFDTGPSLLTMPYVLQQLFEEAGRDWREYVELAELPVICNYFWDDGVRLSAFAEPERFAAEVEAKTGTAADRVAEYLRYCGRIHHTASELFLWNSLHDRSTFFSRLFWQKLVQIGKIDPFRTMHEANARFFSDPRVVQLFDRYATYNGSSPYQTPATLNIIPYVEYVEGGYAVVGGIHAIPRALEKLAVELGVEIRYETKVDAILVDQDRRRRTVRGVRVAGHEVPADVVVSNVDVSVTYPDLLADHEAPELRRYRRLEPSSSGLVFYWGMNRRFPELSVNNIFFSNDYQREFHQIFHERVCPDDPTVYVNITSKVTPADAPAGGENWFVLINAPYVDGQDWAAETRNVRAAVLARLSRVLDCDVESAIGTEAIMAPPDIERKTMSYRGALYGISSNSRSAAFSRHPNRSKRYKGLYFCGGSAHPGGGMPLVMLSGKIAADLIRADYRTVGERDGKEETVTGGRSQTAQEES